MSLLKERCLWPDLVDETPSYPPLTDDIKDDVCVIGAGITGLSAAIHLAERGKSVAVVEAAKIANGGSGKNVGLVNAGTWNQPDAIVAELGEEAGERLNNALGNAPSLLFSVINRYQMNAQSTETGTLHMAHSHKGIDELETRYEQFSRRNINVELLTGARCTEYCGTDKIPAALLDHRAGTVNPYAYVGELARVATELGVKIYENSPVKEVIQEKNDEWIIKTTKGKVITAEKTIIATNAYTEGDWSEISQTIYTGHYYQVASVPLSGDAADSILPHKQGSWDTRLVLSSIRRDRDGRLILGSMGRSDNKSEWYLKTWAKRIQEHYYPQLGKAVEWEYAWCGRIGFTDNHIPKFFEPAKGLVAAIGYNGRGIAAGTMFGKLFADYLIDGDASQLPLPFHSAFDQSKCSFRSIKALYLETGFTIYHYGQCLNIIR